MKREAAEALAARYVLSLDQRGDDPALRAEVEDWLTRDPHNAVAFARAEAAWEAAGRALERQDAGPAEPAPTGMTRRRMLIGGGALAASVAGLGVIRLTADMRYETGIGQVRDVRLAGGWHVRLNTDTQIEVARDRSDPTMRLRRGEAFFDIAAGDRAPLRVAAAGTFVRAVDTAFNLRMRDHVVELTVTRGSVLARGADTAIRRVGTGDSATIQSRLIALARLDPRQLDQRIAWRERMIELGGDTVAQAVEEFNRYRTTPIVVADQRVGALRIGGRFPTTESAVFLRALEQSLPVRVVSGGDGSAMLLYRDAAMQRS
jgi:transmembrane sensor